MSYANDQERSSLIAGLRALADFLEGSPEVPAPRWTDILVFPATAPDSEMRAEIDNIAALIGSAVEDQTAEYGHYQTSRSFGSIQYRALAVLARARAHHDALMSYSDCVTPDSVEEV